MQHWWLVAAPEGTQLPAKYASLLVAFSHLKTRRSRSAINRSCSARSSAILITAAQRARAHVRPAKIEGQGAKYAVLMRSEQHGYRG